MTPDHPSARWLKRVARGERPIYLALVAALDSAIRDGELQAGDQLPPQRTVAELLGVDFTTVTRAYGAARARGLVEGAVGRGTYVRHRASDDDAGRVDLTMNLPPPPRGVSLAALLKEATRAILDRTDAATLMAYHPDAGTLGQKTAGASWLAPCLGDVSPSRVLVCPGAQAALTALLSALGRRGDALVVEPLTYPGLQALARQLGLRLAACPVDDQGFLPEALARICADEQPAAIYVVPTMQNPVASTMDRRRRQDVAGVAAASGTWLIEDDPYSRLFDQPLPALASYAPERCFYIGTLSKCLSPGLRTAFMVTPDATATALLMDSLRATSLMGSPLMAAVVAHWIRDGAADALLSGVRREARERREIAARILPSAQGAPEAIHVWLDLPDGWPVDRLHRLAEQRGLSLVTADAFATTVSYRSGMRISLGGPAKQSTLVDALQSVSDLLDGVPAPRRVVV